MTKPQKVQVPAWQRCEVSQVDAQAIHAMHAGNANEAQQKNFMRWLSSQASPTLGLAFDPTNERASAFEAGRRFVALKIIEVVKTPLSHYQQGADLNG